MLLFRSKIGVVAGLIALVLAAGAFAACGDDDDSTSTPSAAASSTVKPSGSAAASPGGSGGEACPPSSGASSLTGDGSTFVQPLFQDILARYKTLCNVEVNYQGVGSGQGIKDLSNNTVDFAASDAIMNDDQKAAAGGTVLHVPVTSDAVAVIYNVEGVDSQALTLDGTTLANIFLGKITKWNDPAIAALNPGVTLPSNDITVVHRSDGSGTTFIFTNYLSKISSDWKSQVSAATSVNWPVGIGQQGNSGVAGSVQQQPNTIGYVSFAYAITNNIAYAKLKNAAGNTVAPSIESARAASEGITLPDNMEVVITNSSGQNAYPIAGFTWLLIRQEQTDKAKAITLDHLARWIVTDAQQYAEADKFVSLSQEAQTKALAELDSVTFEGTPTKQLQ